MLVKQRGRNPRSRSPRGPNRWSRRQYPRQCRLQCARRHRRNPGRSRDHCRRRNRNRSRSQYRTRSRCRRRCKQRSTRSAATSSPSGAGPRLSQRCTVAARSCCHHDGALILPVGDSLGRCRPMDAELRARHQEQPLAAKERVRLQRTPGPTRPARPGARPHLLIDGVQGSAWCGTATQGRRDRIAGSGRHRWAQHVQPSARISADQARQATGNAEHKACRRRRSAPGIRQRRMADSGAGLMPDRRLVLTVDARPTGHWTRGARCGRPVLVVLGAGHRRTTQEPARPEVASVACAAASGWWCTQRPGISRR
jgi:hypothetical protein